MNNSTLFNDTHDITDINPAIYGWQIASGLTMFSINGLCFVTTLKHDILRKRKAYILMATLNLLEMFWALGSILGGSDRLYLHYNNKMAIKLTRWHCFLKPQTILWLTGICSYGFGHLSVATDRILSIIWPQKHHSLGWPYVASMVVFSFTGDIYILPYLFYEMSKFINTNPSMSSYCSVKLMIPELPVWVTSRSITNGALFLSVLISLYIIVRLGCCGMSIGQDDNLSDIAKDQRNRQQRLAMSVALSSVTLVGMTLLPGIIQAALQSLGFKLAGIFDTTHYVLKTLMMELGTVADFFILTYRHIEVRMGIQYLFQRKRLTKRAIAQAKENKVEVAQVEEFIGMTNQVLPKDHLQKNKQQIPRKQIQAKNQTPTSSSNEMHMYRKRIQRAQRLSQIVKVIEL